MTSPKPKPCCRNVDWSVARLTRVVRPSTDLLIAQAIGSETQYTRKLPVHPEPPNLMIEWQVIMGIASLVRLVLDNTQDRGQNSGRKVGTLADPDIFVTVA